MWRWAGSQVDNGSGGEAVSGGARLAASMHAEVELLCFGLPMSLEAPGQPGPGSNAAVADPSAPAQQNAGRAIVHPSLRRAHTQRDWPRHRTAPALDRHSTAVASKTFPAAASRSRSRCSSLQTAACPSIQLPHCNTSPACFDRVRPTSSEPRYTSPSESSPFCTQCTRHRACTHRFPPHPHCPCYIDKQTRQYASPGGYQWRSACRSSPEECPVPGTARPQVCPAAPEAHMSTAAPRPDQSRVRDHPG
jgi:hypothetical protein